MDQSDDRREEAALLRQARWGSQTAFTLLYHRHARAIHTLAFRMTGDVAAAQDITQETFLRMLGFLSGLRTDRPLRPWLKRVAANIAIDRLRRNRHMDSGAPDDWPDHSTSAETAVELHGLLQRLPPHVRTVMWLYEMEGWSHRDLARRFGRSESWSKSIVSRAHARLRRELESDESPD